MIYYIIYLYTILYTRIFTSYVWVVLSSYDKPTWASPFHQPFFGLGLHTPHFWVQMGLQSLIRSFGWRPRLVKKSLYNIPCAWYHLLAWLVVWDMAGFWLSIYWECHHPNWRTPSFFRGVGIPPTSICWLCVFFHFRLNSFGECSLYNIYLHIAKHTVYRIVSYLYQCIYLLVIQHSHITITSCRSIIYIRPRKWIVLQFANHPGAGAAA